MTPPKASMDLISTNNVQTSNPWLENKAGLINGVCDGIHVGNATGCVQQISFQVSACLPLLLAFPPPPSSPLSPTVCISRP